MRVIELPQYHCSACGSNLNLILRFIDQFEGLEFKQTGKIRASCQVVRCVFYKIDLLVSIKYADVDK